MNRICTICARGGSKGVPGKNIRILAGKPLIAHSIICAKSSSLFDIVAVSSDSDEILNIAKKWGADIVVKRPDDLATDNAPKHPAVLHCVQEVEHLTRKIFDTVVDLEATSPLRLESDIKESVKLLEEKKVSNIITAAIAKHSPYFDLIEVSKDGSVNLSKVPDKKVVRRQDSPACYDMNGSIYAWSKEAFWNNEGLFNADTLLYVMPDDRSVEIDSELDFEFVEFLLKRRIV